MYHSPSLGLSCVAITLKSQQGPPQPPLPERTSSLSARRRRGNVICLFCLDTTCFLWPSAQMWKASAPPWFYSRLSSHRSSSLGKPGKHVVSFGLGFTERRRRKSTSQATVLKGWSRRGCRTAPRRVHFTFVHITPTAVTSRCFVVKSKDASLWTSTRRQREEKTSHRTRLGAGTAYHLRDNLRSHPCCDRELTSRMEMRFRRASRLSLKWEPCFPGGGPRACLFLVTHLWKITCSSMRTGVNQTFNKYNRQGYSAAGSPAVPEYKLGFRVRAAPPPPLRWPLQVSTTGRLHELQLKWVAGDFRVILREICWGEV